MNRSRRITIEEPVARAGDAVMVRNYRKRPAVWERGVVMGEGQFTPNSGQQEPYTWTGRWTYRVRLDRRSEHPNRRGNYRPIDLHVDTNDITAVTRIRRPKGQS